MCKRHRSASLVVALSAFIVSLAAPVRAVAQQRADGLRDAIALATHRADSIGKVVQGEKEALSNEAPPHTLRAGLITLRLDTSRIGSLTRLTLRRAAEAATASVRQMHGTLADSTLGGREIVVALQKRQQGVGDGISLHVRGWTRVEGWAFFRLPLRAAEVEEYLTDFAALIAAQRAGATLQAWTGSHVLARATSADEWTEISVLLASAQSEATRRCVAGRSDACASALELDSLPDRLAAWYAPDDYPSLVEHWIGWTNVPQDVADSAKRCARTRATALCTALVRRVSLGSILPASARRSLVSLAMETGGPHALERLVASQGTMRTVRTARTMRAQLAAAAGVSADSLLALWQARVMAATPRHDFGVPALATIGWGVLLAAVSLRRPRCD